MTLPQPPSDPVQIEQSARVMAAELVAALPPLGLTIGFAESCTGGLVGHWLTEVPGSSRAYAGSIVAYHNGPKERLLGVPHEVLREHGAVSEACALAMARGARAALGVDIAVAMTGIAGPEAAGGKPAGLVWLALADADGEEAHERAWNSRDRSANKLRTGWTALRLVLDRLAARAEATEGRR